MVVIPSGKQQGDVEPLGNPVVVRARRCKAIGQTLIWSTSKHIGEKDIQAVKKSCVSKKTLQNAEYAQRIWCEWATHRLEQLLSAENCGFRLDSDITKMSTPAVNHWLQ